MTFIPLHDRVLVERIEQNTRTTHGIIIPDSAKEKPAEGIVISVGTGQINDSGVTTPMIVKKGDKILFAKWGGTEVKIENKDFLVMKESDILGIIKK